MLPGQEELTPAQGQAQASGIREDSSLGTLKMLPALTSVLKHFPCQSGPREGGQRPLVAKYDQQGPMAGNWHPGGQRANHRNRM